MESVGYDETSGLLIAAPGPKRVREMAIVSGQEFSGWSRLPVKCIGYARPGVKEGVLMKDFKAA